VTERGSVTLLQVWHYSRCDTSADLTLLRVWHLQQCHTSSKCDTSVGVTLLQQVWHCCGCDTGVWHSVQLFKELGKASVWADLVVECCEHEGSCLLVSTRTHTHRSPASQSKPWLRVKYNYFEIILKLFQCFISHVKIISDAERALQLFRNHFRDTELWTCRKIFLNLLK